ncbi:hypothetical protein GE061_002952 [Apolygus lucorum]|uniref:Uncharacterized protein n=1 Tax=Apolygus lucorum TaxID=248454 RepID=A0A6A4JUM3_APOLU|nr:hypothetical protein GE061_002952 [Apolygus lucorum]
MKFAVSVALLALVVVVASAATPAPFTCTGKVEGKNYKDPNSASGFKGAWSCMKYHTCVKGNDVPKSCFWLIPLRKYDPKSRACTWFWDADCDAVDPTP